MQLIRLATALANTVPNVTLRLTWEHEHTGYVSEHPAAAMTASDLRLFAVSALRFGNDRVVSRIADIDIASGLVDLGGGVYAESTDPSSTRRWLVATLPRSEVLDLVVPQSDDDGSVDVEVHVDVALGTTVVELSSSQPTPELERVTDRINSRLLVRELTYEAPVAPAE